MPSTPHGAAQNRRLSFQGSHNIKVANLEKVTRAILMTSKKYFKKVFEPGYIGPVRTRNQIIKSAASMFMSHEDDIHLREEVKAYHERLAKGGVGLIIVEAATIDYPKGARFRNRIRNDDDKYIGILS